MKRDRQADKAALLKTFTENRLAILEVASAWPPERAGEIFLGEWSLLDLLAHMTGWHNAYLEAFDALRNGRLPEFYAHKDADWRSFNAHLVKQYRRPTFAEQIVLFNEAFGKLAQVLSEMSADEFFRESGVRYRGYRVTVARLVEGELKDERVHLEQMRKHLA